MTDAEATDHYRVLRAFLWRGGVWSSRNDHEDLLQEAIIHILRYADPFPADYALRGTIYVRAIQVAYRNLYGPKWYRHGKRALMFCTEQWSPQDMDDAFSCRAADGEKPIIHDSIRHAMRNLDAKDRAVLCLAADNMMSTHAGRYLGVTRQAGHMRLRNARLRAKAAWPRDFDEISLAFAEQAR